MADRILAWLSASVLAAGLSAATIAGTGVAVADDDAGANAATSSQSTASTDTETESDADKPGASPEPGDEVTDETVTDEEAEEAVAEEADVEEVADESEEVAEEVETAHNETAPGRITTEPPAPMSPRRRWAPRILQRPLMSRWKRHSIPHPLSPNRR